MEKESQEDKTPGKIHRIQVGSKNFLSQLFFIWVFRFIYVLRRDKSDFKNINLNLCDTETSIYNDDILEKKWQEEKLRAIKDNRFLNLEYININENLGLN